jgi:hypothetical protein
MILSIIFLFKIIYNRVDVPPFKWTQIAPRFMYFLAPHHAMLSNKKPDGS